MMSADDAFEAVRLIFVLLIGGYIIFTVAKAMIGF